MARAKRHKKVRGTKREHPVGLLDHLRLFLQHNRVGVRSCLIFALCIGLSIFAYSKLVETDAMLSLRTVVAQSTGAILNVLGAGVQVDGTLISSAGFSMIIVNECTGIVSIIILLCAVFPYPCKIKGKLLGIAIGMPALFLLNLARMVCLFYIGTFLPGFFETAHILVWQSLMVLAVIAIWFVWAEKVVRVKS